MALCTGFHYVVLVTISNRCEGGSEGRGVAGGVYPPSPVPVRRRAEKRRWCNSSTAVCYACGGRLFVVVGACQEGGVVLCLV